MKTHESRSEIRRTKAEDPGEIRRAKDEIRSEGRKPKDENRSESRNPKAEDPSEIRRTKAENRSESRRTKDESRSEVRSAKDESRSEGRGTKAEGGPKAEGRAPGVSRGRAGFTLIELLLVLAILGILAAIVVPKFSGRTEQARVTAAQSQIATFGTALDAFEVDNGYYPKGKDGLLELVEQPRDAQNWKGPYLKSDVPNDPWGRPYVYECPGRQNANSYDLMSLGPDGREGTEDDITNWQTSGQRKQ